MKYVCSLIGGLIFMVTWVAGAVLANGFVSTLCCIFFFPWSWYLVVERLMQMYGMAP